MIAHDLSGLPLWVKVVLLVFFGLVLLFLLILVIVAVLVGAEGQPKTRKYSSEQQDRDIP